MSDDTETRGSRGGGGNPPPPLTPPPRDKQAKTTGGRALLVDCAVGAYWVGSSRGGSPPLVLLPCPILPPPSSLFPDVSAPHLCFDGLFPGFGLSRRAQNRRFRRYLRKWRFFGLCVHRFFCGFGRNGKKHQKVIKNDISPRSPL